MRLRLDVRDLLITSWEVELENVRQILPPRLEPAQVDGRCLVSLVAFRCAGGVLGRIPVPPFSQLNARTYVWFEDEPAVFFVRAHVTPPALPGVLLGAPYRPARLRFAPGAAEGPGLGISIRYRLEGRGEPGELGRHELGLFESGGLRGFRITRGPAAWERAVPLARPRADLLLALGFDVHEPVSLLYAASSSFETDVPPRRVR